MRCWSSRFDRPSEIPQHEASVCPAAWGPALAESFPSRRIRRNQPAAGVASLAVIRRLSTACNTSSKTTSRRVATWRVSGFSRCFQPVSPRRRNLSDTITCPPGFNTRAVSARHRVGAGTTARIRCNTATSKLASATGRLRASPPLGMHHKMGRPACSCGPDSMQHAWHGQYELRNWRFELHAVLGRHLVTALHRTHRRRKLAATGVFKTLPRRQ